MNFLFNSSFYFSSRTKRETKIKSQFPNNSLYQLAPVIPVTLPRLVAKHTPDRPNPLRGHETPSLLGRRCPHPSWLLSSRASFSSIAPPQCKRSCETARHHASGPRPLRRATSRCGLCVFFFKSLLPKRSRVLHCVNFKSLCGISGNRVLRWYFLDLMIFWCYSTNFLFSLGRHMY